MSDTARHRPIRSITVNLYTCSAHRRTGRGSGGAVDPPIRADT